MGNGIGLLLPWENWVTRTGICSLGMGKTPNSEWENVSFLAQEMSGNYYNKVFHIN